MLIASWRNSKDFWHQLNVIVSSQIDCFSNIALLHYLWYKLILKLRLLKNSSFKLENSISIMDVLVSWNSLQGNKKVGRVRT